MILVRFFCWHVVFHGPPTDFGDPTGTGKLFPPINISGPGRGSSFRGRGGAGPPAPPRPVAILTREAPSSPLMARRAERMRESPPVLAEGGGGAKVALVQSCESGGMRG